MMVRGVTRKPTVFIVDRDAKTRRFLGQLLQDRGYRVESFLDPPEFFEQYEPDRPGCLVLDCEFSGAAARDTERCLREWSQCLPVVVISARAEVRYVVSALKAGIQDFLVKPLQPELFLDGIRQAVRRDEERRRVRSTVTRWRALFDSFTDNEWNVLEGIVDGRTNKLIARDLRKSPKTVEYYRKAIMAKLNVQSVAELVRAYLRVFPEEPGFKPTARRARREDASPDSHSLDANRRP